MISLVVGNQGTDFLVAIQAFGIGYLLTYIMTLCAITHSFKVGMGSG